MAADGWKIESKGKEKNERKGRKEFWPKEKSQKEEPYNRVLNYRSPVLPGCSPYRKGISLQQKVNANASRLSSLDSQIEEEKQRTDDITALKEYMQTDEYIEKTAREKLGMVKDNEILFKESQSK